MRVRFTITFEMRPWESWDVWMAKRILLKIALRRFGMRCVGMTEEQVYPEPLRREPRDLVEGGVPGWRSRNGQGRFWCERGRGG